jgi:hypothetical protein
MQWTSLEEATRVPRQIRGGRPRGCGAFCTRREGQCGELDFGREPIGLQGAGQVLIHRCTVRTPRATSYLTHVEWIRSRNPGQILARTHFELRRLDGKPVCLWVVEDAFTEQGSRSTSEHGTGPIHAGVSVLLFDRKDMNETNRPDSEVLIEIEGVEGGWWG